MPVFYDLIESLEPLEQTKYEKKWKSDFTEKVGPGFRKMADMSLQAGEQVENGEGAV